MSTTYQTIDTNPDSDIDRSSQSHNNAHPKNRWANRKFDETKIIDLTSDLETPHEVALRRTKSQQIKSDSKPGRLAKYLQKHRASLACTPSRESESLESKIAKSPKMSLQDDYLLKGSSSSSSTAPYDKTYPSSEEQGYSFNSANLRKRRSEPNGGSHVKENHSLEYLPDSTPLCYYQMEKGSEKCSAEACRHSALNYIDSFDYFCKIVLLGVAVGGITWILIKFKDGNFLSGLYISTVGLDFRNKIVNVDGSKVKLQIWDTAGQERFRSVTHAYYRDAHALLLLYDVTSRASFDNTRAWLAEVHEYAQDDVVIMLIGNKCDISATVREIKKEDGERLAKEYNVAFMETSAKTGLNVDLAFTAIARDLKCRKSGSLVEKKFNVVEYVNSSSTVDQCGCVI